MDRARGYSRICEQGSFNVSMLKFVVDIVVIVDRLEVRWESVSDRT